eukprot:303796_1
MQPKPCPLKISVLGAGAVGKSSMIVRLVANDFMWSIYDPTIEDSYTCTISIDGKNETLDILDTCGQYQYAALQDHWIRESDAFMLVYAINSHRSFEHAKFLFKSIQRNKEDQRIDLILVGNKSDLYSISLNKNKFESRTIQVKHLVHGFIRTIQLSLFMNIPIDINVICLNFYYSEAEVSFEMGNNLAAEWTVPFIETSAKTNENVEEAFKILFRETKKPWCYYEENVDNNSINQNCCEIM